MLAEQRERGGGATAPGPARTAWAWCCSGSARSRGDRRSSKNRRAVELRQLRLVVRLHHLADRHAGPPQRLDDLVGRPGAHHSARWASMRSCGAPAPSMVARSGSAAQAGSPSGGAQRAPLLVGGDGDGDPAVVPAALVGAGDLVQVLRCRGGPPVAGAARAARRRRRTRSVCSAAMLRAASTMAASTRPPSPVRSRCSSASSRPNSACSPALGSPTQYGSNGQQVRVPGQPGEPGRVLDDEGERGRGRATARRGRNPACAP